MVGTPEQFSFDLISTSTFTVKATQTRHIQATFKVTNNTSLTLDNLKFVPVTTPTSADNTTFTNLTYFDGSNAADKAPSLTATQGQTFNPQTGQVTTDAGSSPFVTGLDVSGVDTTGLDISSVKTYGWEAAASLAPGASTNVTFAVDLPMDPAGPTKDPFNFSLQFTSVQDGITLTSAVQQYNRSTKSFGNYTQFPTLTYSDNGQNVTHSLPAYYDLKNVDRTGAAVASVLCSFDGASVQNISDASHPNRYRVEMQALGNHTLQVYPGASCPATAGTPLLNQVVTGVTARMNTITARSNHSLAVKADGTLQSWGYLLGNSTTTTSSTPVTVPGLANVVTVAAGNLRTLAVQSDGSVQSWGADGFSGPFTYSPAAVPGLTGIVGVAGGYQHSLALKADGTVQALGSNYQGQLGNGTTTDSSVPVTVQNLADVVNISSSSYTSLALRADGTVLAWGQNAYGEMGNGTNTGSTTPVQIPNFGNVVSIASGYGHTLALKSDGTIQAWGSNQSGQLGTGTKTNSNSPVTVTGLTNVVSVAAGDSQSLALRADGTVQAWGDNFTGDLGNGTNTTSSTPVNVTNLSGAVAIAAGSYYSLALKADGTMQAWGSNTSGELGDGTTTNKSTPVAVFINGVAQPTP
ncbi:hypothetical protein GCM10008957_56730 [Deinococcus ruber]|uniref:RCC1-like domain-containing protein n=1 Tax=Deinococcus ruber TaxID=1848197 RepID=A0A918KXM3_9DEIO|nr:hypothetical protein GCM10008957_56730 [Deinococcus ruber]